MRLIASLCSLALVASLAAVSPSPAEAGVVETRLRFFGIENVDAETGAVRSDRVILSWFGVTNFAAAIGGHVVLLDAWVPRGEYSGYVPTSPAELAALDPELILLGHGHFDHGADAAEIAALSGAPVVGTGEHCAQIAEQRPGASCTAAIAAGDPPGSAATLDGLLEGVEVTVLEHVHSAAEPPDPSDPHTPAGAPPDPTAVAKHLPSPQDTAHLAQHVGDDEGGSVLWRFEVGDFSMVWHDSSGPLKERAPEVLDALASLRPVDVQLGAIMGFNQVTNGFRDPRLYVERLRPRVFVPTHHDNWAPPITTRGENYEPIWRDEVARIPAAERPIVRFISDPQDYVRPEVLTFDVNAPAWK